MATQGKLAPLRNELIAAGFRMTDYAPLGTNGMRWQQFQHPDGRLARIERVGPGRYVATRQSVPTIPTI